MALPILQSVLNVKGYFCRNRRVPIMRIALYQPDIPQNTGNILRMAACFGVPVDVIGPCGFLFSTKLFRRSGMDYLDHVDVTRYDQIPGTVYGFFICTERYFAVRKRIRRRAGPRAPGRRSSSDDSDVRRAPVAEPFQCLCHGRL